MKTIYIINLIILILNVILLEKYFHIFQLKDYKAKRYIKFFKFKVFINIFYIFVFILQLIFKNLIFIEVSNCIILIVNLFFSVNLIKNKKTPINFTSRLKRLYLIASIILALPCLFLYGAIISILLLMFVPILANFINIYDKIKNAEYIKKAQEKLSLCGAKIIAITGSNGKTSVKNILTKFLKNEKAICTPKSYNTPLGIAKFINDTNLEDCKFLIFEYGARKHGDIKKLCKTFGADYGIITSVAPQHLETFKSVENVYKTKKELSDFLINDLCIYNLDNIYTYRMYQEKSGKKVGVSIYNNADLFCDKFYIRQYKTYFNVVAGENKFSAYTKLLGRHNITNILLASALAIKLGVDIETILSEIKKLEFVPHRLELIKSNINILDDSYNCSLASAKEALYVLSNLNGKKVVATPGIIEGGKSEFNINFELGKMLTICDEVIIIGNHNKLALMKGLISQNYKKIVFVSNLEEAKTRFKKLNKDDTLLLLNDLPDDYN